MPPRLVAVGARSPELAAGGAVPRHVAIIMDGNGRWAQERGLSRQAGHRAGTENIRRIIQTFGERGVQVLTLYAFSTENWTRPRREVNALVRLIPRVINREIKELHANGVKLVHIGSLEPLPSEVRRKVEEAIELTKDNARMTVALAFNYGGRAEIIDAVRRIVQEHVPPEQIDDSLFSHHLYTAEIGDPDLVVRTAGEMRLSNFLLWQSAYAEFYATPTYWPDFDEGEIDRALEAYAQRQRRFGGVEPANGARPGR
ncbi:MAG TPA: isoprenyl transferase [Dehalococcoidia bacterium]|nr:isoprenyl transferase [Dehalococcoidia bacterium]